MGRKVIIYGDEGSGNCLKVKYVSDYLGIGYQWRHVDILQGETRTPTYLARNPMGQIPLLELSDGRYLAQSNAILRYLARDSSLIPDDHYLAAKMDAWLFWEQYSHEPYIAVCRYQMMYLHKTKEEREPMRVERGEAALDLMDKALVGRSWLMEEGCTLADVALLPYTSLAHEGGFDLGSRRNIQTWIVRCEDTLGLSPVVK